MQKKKPQNEGQTDSGILSTIKMKIELICFSVSRLLLCLVSTDVVMTKKIQQPQGNM